MDESQIRRHMTAPRRVVMEIIAENQPISEADIVQSWVLRRPELAVRHRKELPRMAAQVLWRLENLGWAQQAPAGYTLTELGERARNVLISTD